MKLKIKIGFVFICLASCIQIQAQQTILTVPSGHLSTPRIITVSPNGKWMASADFNDLIIWNAINGTQLRKISTRAHIESISWFPDNTTIAFQVEDYPKDTIIKYDIEFGKRMGSVVLDEVYRMRISKDGKYIYASGGDGELRILDAATLNVVQTILPDNKKLQLTIYTSPDEQYCAAVNFYKISVNELKPGEGGTKKVGKKIFDIKPPFGEVRRYQFSPDGKKLITLVGPDFGMVCFDIASQNVSWSVKSEESFDDFGFTSDGKFIITLHEDLIELYNLKTGEKVGKAINLKDGYGTDMIVSGGMAYIWDEWRSEFRITRFNPITASKDITFTGDYQDGYKGASATATPVFGQYGSKSPLRIWNFEEGRVIKSFGMGTKYKGFGFSPDGSTVAFGKPLKVVDTRTGNEKMTLPYEEFYEPDGVSISTNENYICTWENGNFNVFLYNTRLRSILWKKDDNKPNGTAFSPDEQLIAISYENGTVVLYESETGKLISSISIPGGNNYKPAGIVFKNNNEIIIACGNEINTYNINGQLHKNNYKLIGNAKSYINNFQLSANGTIALIESVRGEAPVQMINVETGAFIQHIGNNDNGFYFTSLLPDGKHVVTVDIHDITSIWEVQSGKKIMDLYSYNDEWLAVTPDGRFDGSQDAINKLYFTKGTDIIPLQNLYEHYYTPDLVTRLLSGERLDPVDNIDNLSNPPTVKIIYEQATRNLLVSDDVQSYDNTSGTATIIVQASCIGSRIDEIRLYQNGKALSVSNRNLTVADDAVGNTFQTEKKYTISLLPGENIFRAIALNEQRTESNPDLMSVVFKQTDEKNLDNNTIYESTVAPVDKNATVHLLVVGINKYDNKNMHLEYAFADASSFKEEIEKDVQQIVRKVDTYFITDDEADKATIAEAFDAIRNNAKPQDVFIFYYAGHGIIGTDKAFYLVPKDISDLKNVQTELETKGISAAQLQQYAIDIAAQKQVFILDACQSAGAFDNLVQAEAGQQRSIALLARSTGTHWMAASGSKQFANEFEALGHGAFTYILLEALKGAASQNNMITVNGLKNYLQKAMPELMKKYRGTVQYPASFGFGSDFPVKQ